MAETSSFVAALQADQPGAPTRPELACFNQCRTPFECFTWGCQNVAVTVVRTPNPPKDVDAA